MDPSADALAEAVEAALPGWVERAVARLVAAHRGTVDDAVLAAASAAGRRAGAEVGARLRTLLDADWDEQRTTPLTLLREAVRYPTEVLRAAGVPEVVRDREQERLFPDDPYDLAPATWADVEPSLTAPGIAWGAAKAMALQERHR